MNDDKGRSWATIIYDESVNPDYIKIIENTQIECYVSPLHDKDLKDDNSGDFKKPHRHILFHYNTNVRRSAFLKVVSLFGGCGAECVRDLESYKRYLTHADNTDKAKYNPEDVVLLNGAKSIDYSERYIKPHKTKSDLALMKECIDICREYNLSGIHLLIEYCFNNQLEELGNFCVQRYGAVNTVINSMCRNIEVGNSSFASQADNLISGRCKYTFEHVFEEDECPNTIFDIPKNV